MFSSRSQVAVDDDIMYNAKLSKKEPEYIERTDYRKKQVDWLTGHLQVIRDIIYQDSMGIKHGTGFSIDGKKFFKNDVTKRLLNEMFDNYKSYYDDLERYIEVRGELDKLRRLGQEEYLVAGKVKELDNEARALENNLNIYSNKIKSIKTDIRNEVYK